MEHQQANWVGMDWTEPQVAQAREIAERIIGQAPGDFGRLVLMSSLLAGRVGEYHHPALDNHVPATVANEVLRSSHEQVFSRWLELVLEEQWKAVSEYLAAKPADGADVPRGRSLEKLIPPRAGPPQRELFLSDLELVLSLIEK
jgi:hypothetical protein